MVPSLSTGVVRLVPNSAPPRRGKPAVTGQRWGDHGRFDDKPTDHDVPKIDLCIYIYIHKFECIDVVDV